MRTTDGGRLVLLLSDVVDIGLNPEERPLVVVDGEATLSAAVDVVILGGMFELVVMVVGIADVAVGVVAIAMPAVVLLTAVHESTDIALCSVFIAASLSNTAS